MAKIKQYGATISLILSLLMGGGSAFSWYMSRQDRLDNRFATVTQAAQIQSITDKHEAEITSIQKDLAVVKNDNNNFHSKIDEVDKKMDKFDTKLDKLNDKL